MKYFKNPYYSSDNRDFVSVENVAPTPERMRMIKLNNNYVFSIFLNIMTKEDFTNSPAMKKYMSTIFSGNLVRTDKVTGYDSKNLGKKIRFLVSHLSDKKHPENLEKFKKSFFYQSILVPFFYGGYSLGDDNNERWELYERIGTDPAFKGSSALNAATKCYLSDPTLPVGLDMSALIDGIIKTNEKGEYELVEDIEDLKVKENMIASVQEFINLLKSSKKFKENYNNPNLFEIENEDD